uniref:Uncharacterized protein n=1 Tax=Opuntia streptacantha TaxID=393608 RepID=A0A7C9EKF3_OPUST
MVKQVLVAEMSYGLHLKILLVGYLNPHPNLWAQQVGILMHWEIQLLTLRSIPSMCLVKTTLYYEVPEKQVPYHPTLDKALINMCGKKSTQWGQQVWLIKRVLWG